MLMATLGVLLVAFSAQPEAFHLVEVDSITSPPDEAGEMAWSTADMDDSWGWQPVIYDAALLTSVFGEPRQVAPDMRGWAFAHVDAPDFGVALVPAGDGRAIPVPWDWGSAVPPGRGFHAGTMASRAYSAWLNALAAFQQDVNRAAGR